MKANLLKRKYAVSTIGIMAIAMLSTSCSSSEDSEWREVTIEEALPVASHIYDSLFGDSPDEAVSALYSGPRSFTVHYPYLNDCLIYFYSDEGEEEDYYYQCIYETFDGLEVMTQQRWFYGNEDSYNAGYVYRNEDGSIKEKGELNYNQAHDGGVGLICGDNMWNSYYDPILTLLSYDGEASYSCNPHEMTLKRFFIKGDDDLILSYRFFAYDDDIIDHIYVYKDNIITYCDSDSEDNAYCCTTEFSYGEFEKVYPTLPDE